MATGMISIGTLPPGTKAEPQPQGQQEGAAGMVRLKPSSTEGVSTKAKDFVYVAKECGYPYLVLAIGSLFAWYGAGWIGPNIIAKAIEPLATVAKTNEILADNQKSDERNIEIERQERQEIINGLRTLIAGSAKEIELLSEIRSKK